MPDKITISTFQLFRMFPDQESARKYLESRLWPNGVRCPFCGQGDNISARKGGFYRCNPCRKDFTVRTDIGVAPGFPADAIDDCNACKTALPSTFPVQQKKSG
jgi:hypothetical protein